jgi:hypothetical protein
MLFSMGFYVRRQDCGVLAHRPVKYQPQQQEQEHESASEKVSNNFLGSQSSMSGAHNRLLHLAGGISLNARDGISGMGRGQTIFHPN